MQTIDQLCVQRDSRTLKIEEIGFLVHDGQLGR